MGTKEKTVNQLEKGDVLYLAKEDTFYKIEEVYHNSDDETLIEYFYVRAINQIRNTFAIKFSVVRRMFKVGKDGIVIYSMS